MTGNFLLHIDAAKREILSADSLLKVKVLWNKSEALRQLGQAAKDPELINYATEFKLRCERRLGEMLAPEVRQGPHRSKNGGGRIFTLKELEIEPHLSSRAQRIASVSEEKFEAVIAEVKQQEKEITRRAVEKLLSIKEPKPQPPLPNGKYRVFYADPPWQYGDQLIIADARCKFQGHRRLGF